MLLSNQKKFLTIDIPKTGTRSLRETLVPLGIIDVIGHPNPNSEIYQHATGRQIEQYLISQNINIKDYFVFSIVRNPWSRFFSHFNYLLKWKEKYENKSDEDDWDENMERQGFESKRLFDTHIKDEKIIQVLANVHQSQYDYLINSKNELMVDFCAKMETLEKDFEFFCKKNEINKKIELKHSNKNNIYNKSYQDFYNNTSKNIIKNHEHKIINLFQYEF